MTTESFSERCYVKLRLVPAGRVTTYKAIAEALGSKAYRAVGSAMRKNPNAPQVPCHRVVRSDGAVGEYAYGSRQKIALLTQEGVKVVSGRIVGLDSFLHQF